MKALTLMILIKLLHVLIGETFNLFGGLNIAKGDTYEPNDEIAWVERMRNLDYEGELYLLCEKK